jgi:lysyl-tRNA synthetase class 2
MRSHPSLCSGKCRTLLRGDALNCSAIVPMELESGILNVPSPSTSPGGLRRSLPALCSAAALVFGLASVVSVVIPDSRSRLAGLTQLGPMPDPATLDGLAVASGLILIVVSSGLRRRKRRAWGMAMALSVVSAALRIEDAAASVDGLVQAAFGLGLVTCLALSRREFVAAPDPRSTRRAGATLAVCVVASTLVGLGWLWLREDQLVGEPSVLTLVVYVVTGLVGVTGPAHFTTSAAGDHASLILGCLGTATAVAVLSSLLRPHGPSRLLNGDDEVRLRELLAGDASGDSLGYFALRRDKSVIFSPSGKSAICFRVVGGVALASGDPLGDREAWSGAIRLWLAELSSRGWTPAVLGASKQGAEAYRRAGLDALEIGDEAITDVGSFRLEGREMRAVRQAVNRVHRKGGSITTTRVQDLSPVEVRELESVSADWREGRTERGYSMALGRFADPADTDCLVVRAYDRDNRLRGFLHFVPWGHSGLSLDLMRRDPSATNGVVEAMVVAAIAYASDHHIAQISLNFATFRSVFARGDQIGAGPVLRLTHFTLRFLSHQWQMESLYRANAKYLPHWQPRFLCFERVSDLPRVGLSALRAEQLIGVGLESRRTWTTRAA